MYWMDYYLARIQDLPPIIFVDTFIYLTNMIQSEANMYSSWMAVPVVEIL